jgi:hypothetical protein
MPSQLKFSDFDFFNLSKNYDFEIIKNYLEKYFKENRQAKLQNFFKSDKLTSDKNSFIEKSINEELKFINSFSNKLQTLYNKRIELYNKKTKKINPILGLLLHPEYWKKIPLAIEEHDEIGLEHAFIAYTDSVLGGETSPEKFLPYFLQTQMAILASLQNI